MTTEEKKKELNGCKVNKLKRKCFSEHLELWAFIGAILGVLFDFGCYIYSMGIYDYWDIPYEYIDSNKEGMLFRFVLFMIVGLVMFTISTMYMIYLEERTVKKSKLKKICIYLLQFLKIMVWVGVIYILILCFCSSLYEVIMYVLNCTSRLVKQVFLMTTVICCGLVAMGMFGRAITSLDGEICFENVNIKKNIKRYLLVILLIVMAIGWIFFCIYDSGMKYAGNIRKITIATMQDTEYVVVDRCSDKWIIKQCMDEDDGWKIIQSHYMLSELQEIPLKIRTLESGDYLSNHLKENKERIVEKKNVASNKENKKMNFILWCNENGGFLSAVLSILTILISVGAMYISYRVGRLPYVKKLSMIPCLCRKNDTYYIDLTIINIGNAPICIKGITISNREMLDIGITEGQTLFVLKPSEHVRKTIRIYDDLENIKKHELDLNGHIVLTAYDASGKKYQFKKGFPVG